MRYLALLWQPASSEAGGVCEQAVADVGRRLGWTPAVMGEGFLVLAPSRRDAMAVRPWGRRGAVIGELYDAGDGSALRIPADPPPDPVEAARGLLRRTFGRYVAIQTSPQAWAFRDPSGGVECLAWRNGDIQIVASDLDAVPRNLLPRRLSLDWDAIGRGLAGAAAAAAELPLHGLCDVAPGSLQSLTEGAAPTAIWCPAVFAAERRRDTSALLAEELTHRVDLAIGALVGSRERVMAEVSGGLDSAIVAGALHRLGLTDRVAAWVNHYADRPEGDERAYALKVTERIGAQLTPAHLPIRPLTEADFTAVAQGPRLPFNALVPLRDADLAARLEAAGAEALVSGQGGDAAFFQMPTADILADELQAKGLAGLRDANLPQLARWLRRSCWSVLGDALRRPHAPSGESDIAAVPRLMAEQVHPWVRDATQLAPAKRRQILGLANAHVANGLCRAGAQAELLYPLAAQPVIEFCLAVPAAVLTEGGRDRALARTAFETRLPPEVRHRRKKGELTAFHAQTVAASLGFLRDYLLGGCLAEFGLLNRRRLDLVLNSDHLLWRAGAGDILMAAAAEAWVRHWQRFVPDSSTADRYGWAERFHDRRATPRS